jgi:hypothetical protein
MAIALTKANGRTRAVHSASVMSLSADKTMVVRAESPSLSWRGTSDL